MPPLHFQGVGPRIAARLVALRYQREGDGKPDVGRFCKDRGYHPTIFYEWINDRSTPTKDLDRLVEDLETTKMWLLFGETSTAVGAPGRSLPSDSRARSRLPKRRRRA